MYDLGAEDSPLRGAEVIEVELWPEDGSERLRLPMNVEDGIATATAPASSLRPGRFRFRAGEQQDTACGNPPGLPVLDETPVWRSAESAHFVYLWLQGDAVDERVQDVLAELETRRAEILAALGIDGSAARITYLHYVDRETATRYQAHHGNNVDPARDVLFSIEDVDGHELTHLLLARDVGYHVGVFDEGMAIRFGQGAVWRERECDEWAQAAITDGRLPPLRDLLTPEQMYSQPWSVVGDVYYPAGCSFVGFLIERYGVADVRAFLASYNCVSQDDAVAVAAAFEREFGQPLDAADAEWRRSVGQPTADGAPP